MNTWKWNNYEFGTLQQAKNCIRGDFGSKMKELLEYDGYSVIAHHKDGKLVGYVEVYLDKHGYPCFKRLTLCKVGKPICFE